MDNYVSYYLQQNHSLLDKRIFQIFHITPLLHLHRLNNLVFHCKLPGKVHSGNYRVLCIWIDSYRPESFDMYMFFHPSHQESNQLSRHIFLAREPLWRNGYTVEKQKIDIQRCKFTTASFEAEMFVLKLDIEILGLSKL